MSWGLEDKPLPPSSFFKPIQNIKLTRGLKICIWGPPESGKTYFCCSCPPPVYIIDTEFGAAKVAKTHFPDKEIYVYEVKIVDTLDPAKIDYEETVKTIARACMALKDVEEGTICIDSVSDVYTWLNAWVEDTASRRTSIGTPLRLEWAKRNIFYRNLVFRLLSKPVNVVLTAQPQRVYDEHGRETNRWAPRWLQPQPHWADIVIRLDKETSSGGVKYMATIEKCRFMRAFNKRVEDITFQKLVKVLETELGVEVAGSG